MIYALIEGVISAVADTKHALGITGDYGLVVLIHVGIDIVDTNGRGFSIEVKVGDRVKSGQLLTTFSNTDIMNASNLHTTAVLITNLDEYKEIFMLHTGLENAREKCCW